MIREGFLSSGGVGFEVSVKASGGVSLEAAEDFVGGAAAVGPGGELGGGGDGADAGQVEQAGAGLVRPGAQLSFAGVDGGGQRVDGGVGAAQRLDPDLDLQVVGVRRGPVELACESERAVADGLVDGADRRREAEAAGEADIHLPLPRLAERFGGGAVGVAGDLGHLVDAQG